VITSRHTRIGLSCLFLALLLCGCHKPATETPPPALATVQSLSITRTPFLPTPPTSTPTPRPTVTQTPYVCDENRGRIEERYLVSGHQAEPFQYRAYLPPCHAQMPVECYPSLYLLHGQTYNDDQWQRLGAGDTADRLIASGEAKPFIIIMPREEDTYGDIYREGFSYALLDELIPLVGSEYRACSDRSSRAIGGLSRGGAWAIHLGFMNWQLFGAIGAHSTPPFDGDLNKLPAWVRDIPVGYLPRVYLDSGDRDYFHKESIELEAALTGSGVPHEWTVFEGTHDEAYWREHVEDYLRWYAAGWDS